MQENWSECFYLGDKVDKEMHRDIKKCWREMHLKAIYRMDQVFLKLV
jgi:hypothetical protein